MVIDRGDAPLKVNHARAFKYFGHLGQPTFDLSWIDEFRSNPGW